MKKLLFIGLLLGLILVSYTTFGQVQMMNELTITPPAYQTSNYNSLHDLLQASVEYPASAINDRLQGTEVIRYTVTSSGTIEDITVVNSVSWEIDERVTQALMDTQNKWNPGIIDGEPTTMEREISMVFALNSYEDMIQKAQGYMQKGNKLLYVQNKPEKALRYFDMVETYFPYETCVLYLKGYCYEQLGYTAELEKTREKLEALANINTSAYQTDEKALFADNHSTTILVQAK